MLRKIRIVCASFFFLFITLLFLDFTGTIHAWFGWMAKIQFLPALLALNTGVVIGLVVLTLLLGRVYCSVICPLGVFQDIVSWIAGKRKKNRFRYSPARSWLRYGVLALFLLALLAGIHAFVVLLAPYSAYGRMAACLLAPLYQWGNNLLALWAEHLDSYAFYSTEVWMKGISTFVVSLVTFLLLVILAWRNGRTYCNTICPVGTLLGFFAGYAWLKPRIETSKCIDCGLCARNCKASCIDAKNHRIDYSRCVGCMDCIEKCHTHAIHYAPAQAGTKTDTPANGNEVDRSRRRFLSVTSLFATTALMKAQEKTVDGGLALIEEKQIPARHTPVSPAGSGGMRHFAQHCTACQLCISACPNQVLRPSSDWERFMQPEISFERGYCRPECTRCSEVCPTGAIRQITAAEKSSIQTGHAVFIPENCVVNNDGVSCGNCARHCPSGAIQLVPVSPDEPESAQLPVVNEERCIGCGACEYLCPARPFSAIYVEGHERHKII